MEQPVSAVEGYSLMRQQRRMLAHLNFYLTPQSRILDFGCGEGKLVYEYRDAGFDAYGFDICLAPKLRQPEDERYFKLSLTGRPASEPDYRVNASSYRIPFDDNCFDFIFSNSTLEHVQDHELACAEMARVLKPGGVCLHIFPARYVLVEPHMKIPLGGCIQNFPWFLFWALVGIRNQFQHHLGPIGCAEINLRYAKTGLNYLKIRDVLNICKKHFRAVDLVPRLLELNDGGKGNFLTPFLVTPRVWRWATWLYSRCVNVALFLQK
jgi:SAM-dependent methyltransferase